MSGVVIVGTGTAGVSAAESLRTNGYCGPITVVGAEPDAPYRRTALSKDMLSADLSAERITLRPSAFWEERDIRIVTGTSVVGIDTVARRVHCDDQTELVYDALVLATGAEAMRPSALSPDVPVLRSRADAERIRGLIDQADAVTLVGGGLIGLELAASAAGPGRTVRVVEATERLMKRAVPREVSDFLSTLHNEHGVEVRTGVSVSAASSNEVTLADGTVLPGTVIGATGIRAGIGLAKHIEAQVCPAGIVVDAHLRTSVPAVYAAGDVAAVPHAITGEPARAEHWMSATEQGKAVGAIVAADLTGAPASPHVEIPFGWTTQYGTAIHLAGWPGADDATDVTVDGSVADRDATVRVWRESVLLGGVAIGRPKAGRELRAQVRAGVDDITPVG